MIWIDRACRVAIVCVAIVLGGCATLPKTSNDFGEVTKHMNAVAVMPATFSLGELSTFTSQEASELNRDIELEIRAAAETLVTLSRYKKAKFDVSDSSLARDPELRTALFEQNQAMADVFKKLSDTRSRKIDIDFGGNVDLLADRSQADFLLYVEGSGYFSTTGAEVKNAILTGLFGARNADTQTSLAGILLDARTKKVVWYNSVTRDENDPRKPSELLDTARRLTAPLLGKPKIKSDKSRDHYIIDKYKALKKK